MTRRSKLHFWFLAALVFVLAVGCAGQQRHQKQSNTAALLEGEDGNVDLVAELTGVDENTPVTIEKKEEELPTNAVHEPGAVNDEDIIGGTDGAFLAKLLISGQEKPGKCTVKTANESNAVVVQDAPAGQDITLAPGRYDFTFTSTEIAGNPEINLRDVEIVAGRRTRRDVKMPVGEIMLVTGEKCAKKEIKVRPKDAAEWYKGKFFTCVPIVLMAGEYEAEMGGKEGGTAIRGIQVYDGSIRNVLIRSEE